MTTPSSSSQTMATTPDASLPGHRAVFSALAAGSVAVFVAFVAFMFTGHPIGEVMAWMVSLGLVGFGGVFAVVYFIELGRSHKH